MIKRRLESLTFDHTYARPSEAFYAKLNPTPYGRAILLGEARSKAVKSGSNGRRRIAHAITTSPLET